MPLGKFDPMELIESFAPELVGGDMGLSAAGFSALLVCVCCDAGVPSDVWMFRLAGGRLEGAGALFFDLNRNAMIFVTSLYRQKVCNCTTRY